VTGLADDQGLARAVTAIFAADDPADGLDRSDGLGEDYVIESLEVVPGEDGFDDVAVTVAVGHETVVARLLYDRTWRQDSGLDDPQAYAGYVVAKWRTALVDDEAPRAEAPVLVDHDELETLLAASNAGVTRTRRGLLEVVDDDGEVFTLHATPQEWRAFAAGRRDPVGDLEELIGSRWDDETHIVFFRGAFHRSIRPELPPVRSMLLREDAGG
jgi:hypothetical protein